MIMRRSGPLWRALPANPTSISIRYLPEPPMTQMKSALRLAAIGLPVLLAGCDLMGGGPPPPASPAVSSSNPTAASATTAPEQVGGGTQDGLSGGPEGGSIQTGVGIGGVSGLGPGPAAGGGVGNAFSGASNANAPGGPGGNSNPPVAGTGGAP